jgi:hypothetical protein
VRGKLAVLLGGLAAGLLVARLLRRRRRARPVEQLSGPGDPRADALRRQLADSRDDSGATPDAPVAPAEGAHADVDEVRRRVHEHGRAAVEEMRRSGG